MSLSARAYGQTATDLDVAFGRAPADESATGVLAACLGLEPGTVADWSLARRLQALLAVRRADTPDDALDALLRCAGCGEAFEIEIDPARCQVEVDESPLHWRSPEGHDVELRLPCGADLTAWRRRGEADPAHIGAALLLKVDGGAPPATMPPGWAAPLSDMLAERDPFTALQVDAACPDCGHPHDAEIDLEALLLAEFSARQRRLLDEVAVLARAFHWSEAQILALPAWRRAHYIALLDAQGAA